ncbi:Retrovirus-related Pol poly from transposon, partial [Brachionus plicatilis]
MKSHIFTSGDEEKHLTTLANRFDTELTRSLARLESEVTTVASTSSQQQEATFAEQTSTADSAQLTSNKEEKVSFDDQTVNTANKLQASPKDEPGANQVENPISDPSTKYKDMGSDRFEKFVYTNDLNSLGPRWLLWLERFNLFLTASNITAPTAIRANFLLYMGTDAHQIYNSLATPVTEATVIDDEHIKGMYKLMSTRFNAERSQFAEIAIFRQLSRNEGEGVDEFSMRLRTQAALCNFKTGLDNEIMYQFVAHCRIEEFQREALLKSRTDTLTLETTLKLARAYEQNTKDFRDLNAPKASGSRQAS